MRAINTIIEVSQDSQEDARERTVFQEFTELNELLFWVAQQKEYQREIEDIEKLSSEKETKQKHQLRQRSAKPASDSTTSKQLGPQRRAARTTVTPVRK
jgi:hypothetical protein